MTQLSFITTSKGRLHHIRETLPLMMAQGADEVIVVDYGCPDGTGDWVEANHPDATVVRVSDDAGFSPARARNLGARAAKSDWLVFIDGDVKSDEKWAGWMRENLEPGHFYRAARGPAGEVDGETLATFVCARSDFEKIGGFDEVFRSWGGEDRDIYARLAESGAVEKAYPAEFVNAIHHDDSERAGWGGMRSMTERNILDSCYISAKLHAGRALRQTGHLPMKVRENLRENIHSRLKRWFEEGAQRPLVLNFTISRNPAWAPEPYRISSELTFTIRLSC